MGHTTVHKPRHAKPYCDFAAEFKLLQNERIAALKEFIDMNSDAYPASEHIGSIQEKELDKFMAAIDG